MHSNLLKTNKNAGKNTLSYMVNVSAIESMGYRLAERVGFSHAIYYNPLAFNEMQPTAILADTYVLSHLQHPSH